MEIIYARGSEFLSRGKGFDADRICRRGRVSMRTGAGSNSMRTEFSQGQVFDADRILPWGQGFDADRILSRGQGFDADRVSVLVLSLHSCGHIVDLATVFEHLQFFYHSM